MNSKRFLVTAALPYANGPLHIGHVAGVYLPADIFVRYQKLIGNDVAFVCGSDEHGAAITLKAKKEGLTPQQVVDTYHEINKKAFHDFGIEFDIYDRTSSEIHHKTAQEFFLTLLEKNAFTIEEREQYYDEQAQQFLADRYIKGKCPKCGYEEAYGDQCEKCGSTLSPNDLINPYSTLSGSTPVLKPTTHWFLPMQEHEAWLREWINNGSLNGQQLHNPKEWKNHVLGQCNSWIDGGLQPRAMTRDLDWGVKVPLENADGKVLYVWLDAPIGYISATKEWAALRGKNWKDYWQDPNTELVHFIGKDNIVFHCIIFPIILKTHGNYNLPVNVPAYEFLNLEGNKISTSRNWAIWLHEYLEDFPTKKDELRYVLTSIAPENRDSEFTWKDFQERVNSELVAILGNFVNRVVVLTNKYYNGLAPKAHTLTSEEQAIFSEINKITANIGTLINQYKLKEAQAEALKVARIGNKYLADHEPWKLVKTDPTRVETIMNVALQLTANLSIVLKPFLPDTAHKLEQMLNAKFEWQLAGEHNLIHQGHHINQAELLFAKFEDAQVQQQLDKLEASKTANAAVEPVKDSISFEDFTKLDLRIGTIVAAEKVKKAKKLLQLTINTGVDTRTIVSGIAEFFEPEALIGKQAVVLLNLEPRAIRGIESQGMLLMAENTKGELVMVQPANEIQPGSTVR